MFGVKTDNSADFMVHLLESTSTLKEEKFEVIRTIDVSKIKNFFCQPYIFRVFSIKISLKMEDVKPDTWLYFMFPFFNYKEFSFKDDEYIYTFLVINEQFSYP